jgi:hypothetical protein
MSVPRGTLGGTPTPIEFLPFLWGGTVGTSLYTSRGTAMRVGHLGQVGHLGPKK